MRHSPDGRPTSPDDPSRRRPLAPGSDPVVRAHHGLTPEETADSAMTAALSVALLTIGRLLAAGTFFQVLVSVVFAVLAVRRRGRAVAMAAAASVLLGLLLGGIGPASQAFVGSLFGFAAAPGLRRRLPLGRHVAIAVAIGWPIVAASTVGFLAVFARSRTAAFAAGRSQWNGLAELAEQLGLPGVASSGTRLVDWSIVHWWLMVPALQLAISVGYALIVRRVGRLVVDRVAAALGPLPAVTARGRVAAGDALQRPAEDGDRHDDGAATPVPIVLTLVEIRRADRVTAPGAIRTTVEAGDFVALAGPNGGGKSSLLDALAGLVDADGIEWAGPIGLGEPGGTALIPQRPETAVLGLRVVDDLRWGLDGGDRADLDRAARGALATVGLTGRELDETATLSGGELQRLAIAGALARRPRLVLSDESTSMLDPHGRASVRAALVAATGAETPAAVVHATHLREDLATASRIVAVPASARIPPVGASPAPRTAFPTHLDPAAPGNDDPGSRLRLDARLVVHRVGHVHNPGSPWARRALHEVDFTVDRGELCLVRGANGAGKTTLVRVLAGLEIPTEGRVLLDGQPVTGPHRRIGVAFQQARLQLLAATVGDEIASLAGHRDIVGAMAAVGLDPVQFIPRRVDSLSGGETRLALLAGLIARGCDVIIADEPLAGLDADASARIARVVDRQLANGVSVIVVTHDDGWEPRRPDVIVDLVRPDGPTDTGGPA